jgi:ribosome-binding factor A
MRRRQRTGSARDFPRTARLNHLVHEIVADEIERLDDDRLGLLTVVAVEVEPDMRRATVWYTSLLDGGGREPEEWGPTAPAPGDELARALADHRGRLQAAIARQARLKRTPELVFRPDTVIRQAERLEAILRQLARDGRAGDDG